MVLPMEPPAAADPGFSLSSSCLLSAGTEALLSAAPAPKARHCSLRISSRVMEVTSYSRVLRLAHVDLADQKKSSAEAETPSPSLPAQPDPENYCSFEVLSEQ